MIAWALLIGTIVVWAVVEGLLLATGKPTISTEFQSLYRRWPTLGLLFGLVIGLLLGHWFWP